MLNIKVEINNILEDIKKISKEKEIVVAFSGGLDSTVHCSFCFSYPGLG